MQELILSALSVALEKLENRVPQTKNKENFISLRDVEPLKLMEFMRENNVPEDAWFDGEDNGYDAFSDIGLMWWTEIATTQQDKLKFKTKRFDDIAWNCVRDILVANGYKVCPIDYVFLREFKCDNLYNMYTKGEYERIFKFYSFRFKKS